MGFVADLFSGGPDMPKVPPPPPPPPAPQSPVYDANAAKEQRTRAAGAMGAASTDVTKGALTQSADTGKKTLTGQ